MARPDDSDQRTSAAAPHARRRLPPGRSVALVAAGGAAGAVLRVAFSTAFPVGDGGWPWSTFAENVSGAFLLALLLTLVAERIAGHTWVRPLLCTGLLGAYTTFATVSLELEGLLASGRGPLAAGYAAASVLAGLAAALAGIVAARRLAPPTGGRRAR